MNCNEKIVIPDWDELVTETVPGFPLQYLPADCATLVRK